MTPAAILNMVRRMLREEGWAPGDEVRRLVDDAVARTMTPNIVVAYPEGPNCWRPELLMPVPAYRYQISDLPIQNTCGAPRQ